ncbi:helicase domain-containing protein [Mycobacteroides abscessus subsp. bolletii]|uniref:Helicase domain-containing protein n=2 Tax=Mycobacteroides abscessus TaxID=36809 RepID=A0A9Q7SD97_9MYCO|nr:helicase domain-containing protein [Mycobacteroides abscessus subsp. bolletii]SHV22002.1 helicase domain-containing protein [Mycobacteroides abscessus subsp. bolletii]SHX21053.1 helicase domain-containing protein [Mycobacteroides abscessus subsp. bolletii]SKL38030.1 helicase domain-containing protein [Mycobacteroides abscessus subsp. bolletii]SKM62873.1 helicase domain-containing protein [Mycobacteroides abscessus subsp. bolletii]
MTGDEMTGIAPGGSNAPLPPAGDQQRDSNRAEQILIHYILDDVVEALTDRGGGDHPFPWSPDQSVRVGVLGPTISTPPPQPIAMAAGAVPVGNGVPAAGTAALAAPAPPVENRGVIGLDFVVNGAPATVELTIEVKYALYHQLLPDFADVSAEAALRATAAAGNRRRRPTVPLNPTWRRDQRQVTLRLSVPVGRDEEHTLTSDQLAGGCSLAADAATAVANHYTDPSALWKLTNNQTLPVAAASGTEAAFHLAVNGRRDATWTPIAPIPQVTVSTMPTVDGNTAVSVSITNSLMLNERGLQDLSLYDTTMSVTVNAPSLLPRQLGFADDDCRYAGLATVPGRGRGCVARTGDGPNTVVAETLPIHTQYEANSAEPVDISFRNLTDNWTVALPALGAEMRAFHRGWDFSAARDSRERRQIEELRDNFEDEVRRFELGLDLLRNDTNLARAFELANRAFAGSRAGGRWRLFQLVFIMSELAALAGRENPTQPRLRAELDAVDVLWFPTGGGKTEAYLGLIVTALFYDRLRGKERGTTAWLLFPLRMLSVQQLARVNEILHHAEVARSTENLGGDQFSLGYFVGAGNTPNRLAYPDRHGWWPGLTEFARKSPQERAARRLVGACPACGNKDSIGLECDLTDQRLLHVCDACSQTLQIHASDDEVTRYQSSVIVSTVDKICAFARNGQLTAINRGPRAKCPQHGWYTHRTCIAKDCTTAQGTHTAPTGFKDPTPALWVQDELHLVREELGVFAAHYHTLLAELARGAGNEPSKVIAATATIEQFEDQLSQVYGRRPRMFPTGGGTLGRSFYTMLSENVRRIYLGVLPAGGGTVKVDLAGSLTTRIIERIHELTDDPAPLIASMAAASVALTTAEARSMLFEYELALAYVNSKAHGVAILDDLNRLSERFINSGTDRVRSEYLTGERSLGELAAIIAEIQDSGPGTSRAARIRGIVGTSVVSHGVDLDRLNFEILAGMPPSYAHYIQATARAGRNHVGLVIDVFDRVNRRETSMYQSFFTTHAALERMVEPVPVNRFASRAIERTLPGIVCALLWDETRDVTWGSIEDIGTTRRFRTWWNAQSANFLPQLGARIERAYRCLVPVPAMHADEQRLVDDVLRRWDQVERHRIQQWQSDYLTDLFTSSAMTSLRDVDPPTEFRGGHRAEQIIFRLNS